MIFYDTYFLTQPYKEKRSFQNFTEYFHVIYLILLLLGMKKYEEELSEIAMKKAGDAAKKHQVRLSVHPGQYTVLGKYKKMLLKKVLLI